MCRQVLFAFQIIYDTAVTHPHHTLFCVLALANANRDTEILYQAKSATKRGSKLSKSQAENTGDEEVSFCFKGRLF